MKIEIDTEKQTLNGNPLYSNESFEIICDLYMKVGWSLRMPYTYSWLGFPILQIPEDMARIQEVIFTLQPDVIVETGVAHGGSMIFYASLCKLIGHGRIVGVEKGLICRELVESHPLADYITLIEGDSTAPDIVETIHKICRGNRTLVILDSNHSKAHVAKELEAYCDIVSIGSYIVATDGNMCDLSDVPRGTKDWKWNNPKEAAQEFLSNHPEFVFDPPTRIFNDSGLTSNITYWPLAWLRRIA